MNLDEVDDDAIVDADVNLDDVNDVTVDVVVEGFVDDVAKVDEYDDHNVGDDFEKDVVNESNEK